MHGDLSAAFTNKNNVSINDSENDRNHNLKNNKKNKDKIPKNKTINKKSKKLKDDTKKETKLYNKFDMLDVDVSDDEKPIKKTINKTQKKEDDSTCAMVLEEDCVISDKLYKTLNEHHFMPIRMSMANYWGYHSYKGDVNFQFILCKKVEDNTFKEKTEIGYDNDNYDEYFVFVGYDIKIFIGSIINVNNHNIHKNYPRFCCSFEYNDRYFKLNDFHMIIFNYFRIYECSIDNKPNFDDEDNDDDYNETVEESDKEPDNETVEYHDEDTVNKSICEQLHKIDDEHN